jgi:aryl-alcohol dehydrogenase-like predicted oxidoreductase
MKLPIDKRRLGRTEIELTTLGFGASSIGAEFGQFDIPQSLAAVRTAIDSGINFIDTAAYYGRGMSEVLLGQILPAYPRDSLVVSTKLGRYAPKHFDFSAKRVAESVDVSLERMRLEHLDLVFCHDIEYGDVQQIVDETLPALKRQVEKGKVRYVGISGYPMKNFQRVIPTGLLDCVITYNHYTLQNVMALQWLPLAQKHGVGVINAAPFSARLLTDLPLPVWHKAPEHVRTIAAKASAWCKAQGTSIEKLALQLSCWQRDTVGDHPMDRLVARTHRSGIDRWSASPVGTDSKLVLHRGQT